MGRKQYNELNGGDKEGSCSNQGDFTQKFGLDLAKIILFLEVFQCQGYKKLN
ncbi:hypothetical protein EV203_1251 [Caldanaerobacter subterraneus]|uniref:Uncharacterized protein n=1 Tax=Caldanaerobacter subterraneus TaxID=911092 RepID=A0A4R2JKE1_9THEO|nr:hypothetical protein EV203_1251 [Caldanaerobacter subterraneus]